MDIVHETAAMDVDQTVVLQHISYSGRVICNQETDWIEIVTAPEFAPNTDVVNVIVLVGWQVELIAHEAVVQLLVLVRAMWTLTPSRHTAPVH